MKSSNRKLLSTIFWIVTICITAASCTKDAPKPVDDSTEEARLDLTVPAIIPEIMIEIENNQEVIEKDEYLNATITVHGKGLFPDIPITTTRIKGRGNSTWGKPKKPYRLKLDTKASILGLGAAKDWVLLANYQDYTLMTNAVAMKVGQQLGMPYTNTMIPIDVIINGEFRGNYNLTQQIEIQESRVNIGEEGFILELDNHYDEEFKFRSKILNLPIMIKDPDIETNTQFESIKVLFQNIENKIFAADFPNNNYGDFIDKQQIVNYLLINNFVANFEINHPKSVYIFKPSGGKFVMGPIWDFDWGFGIDESTRRYFNFVNVPLLKPNDQRLGAQLFAQLIKDPEIKMLYKNTWKKYRSTSFKKLLDYIEWYAAAIRESQKHDFELWQVGDNNHPKAKADLKTFLRERAKYIDAYVDTL